MKARVFILGGASAVALVVALAQTELIPTASPAPARAATRESRATSVTTPTSDAEINAAGQPLTPMRPEPDTGTMREPDMQAAEQEALGPEEAVATAVDEMGRKRWRIIPLFSAGVAYDDNIFLSNSDRVADVIWTASAGLIFELGDFRDHKENYLSVQWIGQPVIYTENSEQNGFNQYASLGFQYRFNKLVMKLDSSYSIVKGSNRDVNTITTTQTLWNSLAFGYDYSDKTDLNLAFTQYAYLTENFQNTIQYQVSTGMNYQIFPKTRVGFQGVAGVIVSTDTPLQYLQQALVQGSYSATGKLSFLFSGGVQFLEFEGSDIIKIDPVFSFGVYYQPFYATSLSLVGFRKTVGSSSLAGEDYFATGIELKAQQQFFQRVVAAVSLGYENDSYFGTTPDTPTNRVDDYVFARSRLTYAFVDWFSASVFYEYRQTASTQESSSFYNNRVGMEIQTKF
ncbi:MAG TPA: outer membrane beta-barrel protein [Terrimicrobiaceae bacterium]